MTAVELKKGEHLVRKGEATKAIYIVLRGSVYLKTEYNQITLDSGSVLGFMLGLSDEYICDYVAAEDSLIASYKYENPNDYKAIFKEQPKYCYAFLHAAIMQYKTIHDTYRALKDAAKEISDFVAQQLGEYESLCSQNHFDQKEVVASTLSEIVEPEPITSWEVGYFNELVDMPEKNLRFFFNEKEDLTIGILIQVAEIMSRMISNMDVLTEYMNRAKEIMLCEDDDLLEIWYDLALKMASYGNDVSQMTQKVEELEAFLKHIGFYKEDAIENRMKYYKSVDFENYEVVSTAEDDDDENVDGEVAEELSRAQILKTDFTTYIMKYAGYEKEEIDSCKELLKEYEKIAEVQDYTPEMQKTRKAVTKIFYEIYEKAFLRAVKARSISMIMKMFFQFGVLDLQLAGEEHLDEYMAFAELLDNNWKGQKAMDAEGMHFTHVYTAYQWLCLIYRGEKEPSKNEFDVDYAGHLLEMRKNKEITREEENKLKKDCLKKFDFEFRNMFMSNNRITYGKITTFCPVMHKKDFIRSIDQLIVSSITINSAIGNLLQLDYSCFYREVFFAAPEYGIERTEIMKEVLPDVILMPNIGSRAMMWQEAAGVKKDTPARFVLPVMTASDLEDMLMETMGRYRWEICRKILGVRWNDIREKSLTSEFYDYVQFYRKNRDLSQEAKEKVKAELVHAKNNYREVFVADYVNWMKYESQGNFRLNKVSRRIISEYVPFRKEVRKKLEENPMYKELFTKSNIIMGRKREKERVLFERYTAAGGVMTPELEAHMAYYNM